jgi:hypothetical protein
MARIREMSFPGQNRKMVTVSIRRDRSLDQTLTLTMTSTTFALNPSRFLRRTGAVAK